MTEWPLRYCRLFNYRPERVSRPLMESLASDFVGKVAEIMPDLISLDIIMPERDGFEAIKLLKADSRTKNIPVIFLSNMGQGEDIKEGISLGAVDYIVVATITPNELVNCYLDYLNDSQHYVKRYPEFIKGEKIPKVSDKIKKRVRLAVELLVLFLIIVVDVEPELKGKILFAYLIVFGFGRIKESGAYSIIEDFKETFEAAKKGSIFSIVMIIGLSIIVLAFTAMVVGIVYVVLSA